MQTTPTPQSIVIKVAMMFIVLLIELIMNSFVQASFSLSSQSIFFVNFYFLVTVMLTKPIQIVVTMCIFIMMLIMMWQTFPLRYGMVIKLFREFKYTFAFVLLFIGTEFDYLGITAAERGFKLAVVISTFDGFNEQFLFNNNLYLTLYYIRFFFYPVFYAVLINFCLRIIDPIFYKPNKWLN